MITNQNQGEKIALVNGNVCFCKCHQLGRDRCSRCANIHISHSSKAATHENDKSNPNIKK